jgi:hypothetical protein
MSGLVARILLAMLMLPSAAAVALLLFSQLEMTQSHRDACAIVGMVLFPFIMLYWWLLWRRSVVWTSTRVTWTLLLIPLCALGGLVTHYSTSFAYGYSYLTHWVAPLLTPLAWLLLMTLLWRETPLERARRLRALNKDGVTCPACGYNLTGLQSTRCPECGTLYTLDELLASQPSRADAEVKD